MKRFLIAMTFIGFLPLTNCELDGLDDLTQDRADTTRKNVEQPRESGQKDKVSPKRADTVVNDEVQISALNLRSGSQNYVCTNRDGSNEVYRLILYPQGHTSGLVCEALNFDQSLWRAENNRGYCGEKLSQLLGRMIAAGKQCRTRDSFNPNPNNPPSNGKRRDFDKEPGSFNFETGPSNEGRRR